MCGNACYAGYRWWYYASGHGLDWSVLSWCDWLSKHENCSDWSVVVLLLLLEWILESIELCSLLFSFLPVDDIREYFGETIAMYFGFLGFYSLSLVPPVLLVVAFNLSGAHEQTKNTVFAILNLVWATALLEAWKRRGAEMAFQWGTLKSGIGKHCCHISTVCRKGNHQLPCLQEA